jgi:hypothetical protein
VSINFSSPTKILRDETRKKIIYLLNEKHRLSYAELKNTLAIESIEKLDYHLKMLGDLILKEENGEYTLSEKGYQVVKLLAEFPNGETGAKPSWWRKFLIGAAASVALFLISSIVAYTSGIITIDDLYYSLISIPAAIGICYMFQHLYRDVISKETRLKINKVTFILFGAFTMGFLLWIILFEIMRFTGLLRLFVVIFGESFVALTSYIGCVLLGALIGYFFGEDRGFQFPQF